MICQLSAASSNSVSDLQGLPIEALLSLADEVKEREERWTVDRELLARVHEMLQLIRIEALVGMGVKRGNLPRFVPVRRPDDPVDEGPQVVTPRELARMVMTGVV